MHVGDPVTVKFETFPYIQYGYAMGRVEVVSPDAFSQPPRDNEKPTAPNMQSGSPANLPTTGAVYVARISLTEMRMRNLPADFRVTPGMPVTADVHVGDRSILAAMFARAAPLAAEGLRDP